MEKKKNLERASGVQELVLEGSSYCNLRKSLCLLKSQFLPALSEDSIIDGLQGTRSSLTGEQVHHDSFLTEPLIL